MLPVFHNNVQDEIGALRNFDWKCQLRVELRSPGSGMARPVYLQQRTYLMSVATALECQEATYMHCSKQHYHYSITSSARASSVAGVARPIALALLRLMTNSNLVGCKIGSSAGFSPLRMRPV
jgi:hypothetical protein